MTPIAGLLMLLPLVLPEHFGGEDAQVRALRTVEVLGGKITRDNIVSGKPVVAVDLHGCLLTGARLKELTAFKELRTLNLNGTQVTEAGLKGLAGMKGLQLLNLSCVQVTDVGLKELAGLRGLQSLNLCWTEVTDTGL